MRTGISGARMTDHKSDCAVHNEPSMPAGPCDCGAGIVEAIARAICEAHLPPGTCDMGCESCKKEARAALTAALDHMREPSAEMIGGAGARALNKYVGADPADSYYGTSVWADECWKAMLSQLRKEALDD